MTKNHAMDMSTFIKVTTQMLLMMTKIVSFQTKYRAYIFLAKNQLNNAELGHNMTQPVCIWF